MEITSSVMWDDVYSLRAAAKAGDLAAVQALLDQGIHPDSTRRGRGLTALMIAARRGDVPLAQLLLERGANPNLEDFLGGTAVHYANSRAVVQLLQAHGATGRPSIPLNPCELCGAEIASIRTVGHWSEAGGGGGWWLRGHCTSCGVEYAASVRRGVATPWHLPAPNKEALLERLSEGEVERLTRRLSRYKVLSARWQEFLGSKQAGDELWRFSDGEDCTGITIVRGDIPFASFTVFGSL